MSAEHHCRGLPTPVCGYPALQASLQKHPGQPSPASLSFFLAPYLDADGGGHRCAVACLHPAVGAQLGGKLLRGERIGVKVPPAGYKRRQASMRRAGCSRLGLEQATATLLVGSSRLVRSRGSQRVRPSSDRPHAPQPQPQREAVPHQNWSRRRSEPSRTRSSLQQRQQSRAGERVTGCGGQAPQEVRSWGSALGQWREEECHGLQGTCRDMPIYPTTALAAGSSHTASPSHRISSRHGAGPRAGGGTLVHQSVTCAAMASVTGCFSWGCRRE